VARNTVLDNYDCIFYRVCLARHSTNILIIAPTGAKGEIKVKRFFNFLILTAAVLAIVAFVLSVAKILN
jgi:hypothetical protein